MYTHRNTDTQTHTPTHTRTDCPFSFHTPVMEFIMIGYDLGKSE